MKIIKSKKSFIFGTLIIAAAVALLIILISAIRKPRDLSEIEQIALNNYAETRENYLETLDFDASEYPDEPTAARYIAFAVAYSFGEKQQESLTTEEIAKFTKENFNVELSAEEISDAQSSEFLNHNNIRHNEETDAYYLATPYYDEKTLARIPIQKYFQTDARKFGSEFVVTYNKYNYKNPYDALNCIVENNPDHASDAMAYLKGTAPAKDIKNAIPPACTNEPAELLKQIVVIYATEDGRIYIKSIQ